MPPQREAPTGIVWRVSVGADTTTATYDRASTAEERAIFVCAHAHLPAIGVSELCLNGTRDALCTRDLMEGSLRGVTTRWEMHWLEGADHGFQVLTSSGRNAADVTAEIADTTSGWLRDQFRR